MFVVSFRAMRAVTTKGVLKSARIGWPMGPVMSVRSMKSVKTCFRHPIEFHSVVFQYDSRSCCPGPGSSPRSPQKSLYLKGDPQK